MLLRKPSLGGFGRLAPAEVAHLDVPVPVAEVGKTLRLGETASTVAEPPRCVREGSLPVADQATPKRQCEKRQHADGRPGSSSRFAVNEMDAGTGVSARFRICLAATRAIIVPFGSPADA